jgi:hypothetical protein
MFEVEMTERDRAVRVVVETFVLVAVTAATLAAVMAKGGGTVDGVNEDHVADFLETFDEELVNDLDAVSYFTTREESLRLHDWLAAFYRARVIALAYARLEHALSVNDDELVNEAKADLSDLGILVEV